MRPATSFQASPLQDSSEELILAQEQAVTMRRLGEKKALEAEFGVGVKEGTLVLTNKRLIFACTNEKEEDIKEGFGPITSTARLLFSDIDDLGDVSDDPPNIFVPLSSITATKGHTGELTKPKLEVRWTDGTKENSAEFTEEITGKRKKNLNDWAAIIQRQNEGGLSLIAVPKAPSTDTLEGKIVQVLSDMQEKGVMEIEEEVETRFRIDSDPDEVQSACETLVKDGALDRFPDSSGDVFYRRRSPLGEDDFSS
jgi:hypothetical protein